MHMAPQLAESSLAGTTNSHAVTEPDMGSSTRSATNATEQDLQKEEEKKPLTLKDLPEDVLCEIIRQLPHTNDLTSLALCHSVFHSLCIPCIYSRFDIVWPDVNVDTSSRAGVDALTYGLSTLVMAEEVFRETPWQRRLREEQARLTGAPAASSKCAYPIPPRRRGNNFAQYTKKFSLGNGPKDWVQEYLITKEGGKMLGTLVALAVARMHNLETFIWDMPTGVLRDIWLALSSLADRDDGQDCRLEKIWVRWHNNFDIDSPQPNGLPPPPPPPPLNMPPMGIMVPPLPPGVPSPPGLLAAAIPPMPPTGLSTNLPIEAPNFSILPALRSLNVLDIDELAYLDEISILIARSLTKLRELRIGIARHVQERGVNWLREWEGENIHQVDHNTEWTLPSKIGVRRLGGVLGVLVGRIFNLQNNARTQKRKALSSETRGDLTKLVQTAEEKTEVSVTQEIILPGTEGSSSNTSETSPQTNAPIKVLPLRPAKSLPIDTRKYGPYLNSKLEIETLELERVPLSMAVLTQAIDWSRLTSLTLLDCQNHEALWRLLRRQYTPAAQTSKQSSMRSSASRAQYGLNLKKIHTDTVSNALIAMLRETLAPNSLEILFLQEGRNHNSGVPVSAILKGPLQRHRNSLKKLMIDSSGGDGGDDNFVDTNSRWKRWMLTNEVVWFLLSGKMTALRELGITIAYMEWHFLLQNLPNVPHLRSLHLPHIGEHPHGSNIAPMDLVMQIINIVSLRPEMELCYVGMMNKCFEILETHPPRYKADAAGDEQSEPAIAPIPAISTAAWMTQVASNLSMNNHPSPHPVVVEDEDSEGSDAEEAEGEADDDETVPLIMAAASSSSSSTVPSYSLITSQSSSTTSASTTLIMPPPPSPPPTIAPGAQHGTLDQPVTFTADLIMSPPTTVLHPPMSADQIPFPPMPIFMPPTGVPPPPPPLLPPTTDSTFNIAAISMPIVDILDDSDDDPDAFADLESTADLDGLDDDPEDEDYGRAEWEASAGSRFSLREILFYDDKVEVFRARHGRL